MGQSSSAAVLPGEAGCEVHSTLFTYDEVCHEGNATHTEINIYPAPVTAAEPEFGRTMIRVYFGSHETYPMGGSVPSIAVFNEFGERIGQTESKLTHSVPGSFKDIAIKHTEEQQNVRPSYLLLHAGDVPVCISAVSMEYPDGIKQFFTGSDLALCNGLPTTPSRTFFGPQQEQPQCFWLHSGGKDAIGRLSLHLADYMITKTRHDAYVKTPELACRQTPRLWRHTTEKVDLSFPIPIFNPLIDYDPVTKYDKYPERILSWDFAKTGWQQDLSDYRPFTARPPYTGRQKMEYLPRGGKRSPVMNNAEIESKVVEFTDGMVEEERVRTKEPLLAVSEKNISAVYQCRWGKWNNADYVSLSEKIYCDMQSRSMFPFCGEVRESCWDPLANVLVPVGGASALEQRAVVGWNATGPLFGYVYPNIMTLS